MIANVIKNKYLFLGKCVVHRLKKIIISLKKKHEKINELHEHSSLIINMEIDKKLTICKKQQKNDETKKSARLIFRDTHFSQTFQ